MIRLTMPFVSRFPVNVLISYRHADNTSGWVTALHEFLERRITELLGAGDVGPGAGIWRDPQLHGGDSLWGTINPRIADAAVFVPVLSPSYFQSAACVHEFER